MERRVCLGSVVVAALTVCCSADVPPDTTPRITTTSSLRRPHCETYYITRKKTTNISVVRKCYEIYIVLHLGWKNESGRRERWNPRCTFTTLPFDSQPLIVKLGLSMCDSLSVFEACLSSDESSFPFHLHQQYLWSLSYEGVDRWKIKLMKVGGGLHDPMPSGRTSTTMYIGDISSRTSIQYLALLWRSSWRICLQRAWICCVNTRVYCVLC